MSEEIETTPPPTEGCRELICNPVRRPAAPLQFKDLSDEGRRTNELAFHVGRSNPEICLHTSRLVHTGVKGDWRPDTRAEHSGNAKEIVHVNA